MTSRIQATLVIPVREHGMLRRDDGSEIYWETSGDPAGVPAIRLHGGPGSGLGEGYRKDFPGFNAVGLDQRGCGRSRPLATEPGALAGNTTQALIADIEAVREHLGIESWLVTGVSWGTTLALAYAQAYPERVRGLVLAAVTTTSREEVEWITQQMRHVFPREWDAFAAASGAGPGQRVVDAYVERLADVSTRDAAARAWCEWEDVHVSLDPKVTPSLGVADPQFQLLFATLVTHYWSNSAFVEPLLEGMSRIAGIPGTLIHGRLDVSSPLSTAWELHKAWPGSDLIVLDGDGHGGAAMGDALRSAIARHR